MSVSRASRFVAYVMDHDLQILTHRREACTLLSSALARNGDSHCIELSADKFDKMLTYLQQNDQQVHYASAANTVGVYAIVKLVGELRRRLRDYPDPTQVDLGQDFLSPRGPPPQRDEAETAEQSQRPQGVPVLNVSRLGQLSQLSARQTPRSHRTEGED